MKDFSLNNDLTQCYLTTKGKLWIQLNHHKHDAAARRGPRNCAQIKLVYLAAAYAN